MTTYDDAKYWDTYHKNVHDEEQGPSSYAVEKEKLFPRNSLIVELGGGTGEDALYFLRQGHSVVILDISEFALKISEDKAKKNNLDGKLATRMVDFGLHNLPIKDSSVDIVYSRISLHYFEAEHIIKLFQDIYGMLKTGGKAYLTFKSPDDEREMEYLRNVAVKFEEGVYIENGQLRSRFTGEQLKQMLASAKIIKSEVNKYEESLLDGAGKLMVNEVIFERV